MFQSTRPRGARRSSSQPAPGQEGFNPRAHVGRDIAVKLIKSSITCFNPRAHVGRDIAKTKVKVEFAGFNPRAHVGRDVPVARGGVVEEVSIHAPTWGATRFTARPIPSGLCFNPRAHVGRDAEVLNISQSTIQFQSTRPRGARLLAFVVLTHCNGVSIHAPTWGATGAKAALQNFFIEFQSTRPRGARRNSNYYRTHTKCFNPRAHVGRD